MKESGINLDLLNPVGRPAISRLTGFKFARINYNISMGTGSTDLQHAHNIYGGYISSLVNAGITPVLVCTHQMWGEGQGFNWESMSPSDWNRFIAGYTAMIRRVAELYSNLPVIMQVMNEQDSTDGRASVIIPPRTYGSLFNASYAAIKTTSASIRVITGGYISGSIRGVAEYRAAGIIKTDGVAFHPYGASANGLYVHAGIPSINVQTAQWQVLGQPLYITEWGILDKPGEPVSSVAAYADSFMKIVAGKVLAACWYAWSDGMDNGYGVAKTNGDIKQPLFNALAGGITVEVNTLCTVFDMAGSLNFRALPSKTAAVLGVVKNGSQILPLRDEVFADGERWRKI